MTLIPDQRLLRSTLILVILAIVVALSRLLTDNYSQENFWEWIAYAWWAGLAFFVMVLGIDGLFSGTAFKLTCKRSLPTTFSLGSTNRVSLHFTNSSRHNLRITYTDLYPNRVKISGLPRTETIYAGGTLTTQYKITATQRGEAHFGQVEVLVQSPFRFWQRKIRLAQEQTTKIYPNYMAISKLNFLNYEQKLSHIGAHVNQRLGLGLDFKQLREFQHGDELRQIDWKASSRQHKLISREYQDERDQEILFMLDSGRRMRTKDGDLSHFDHGLNAMLLTAYVALSAGDAVGFMSFAGQERWLPPVKGKNAMSTLLNNLYDIHSSASASDLSKAAESLMLRHQKRALVVILTNPRDDDYDDLLRAVETLRTKHIVLVACIKESLLDESHSMEVNNFTESIEFAATEVYTQHRNTLLQALEIRKIPIVDATPKKLHVALVNKYMALKAAGRI
ncbi:DUF58 domain-containing protein [Marinibactrum halimedae]|uniref:DUF58 domain-containing protein n=1 Tax=Marinibactrum halimedae TaxID=1444977 RepID=A0AA37TAZ8_9GAMM|nr:DUF58 domain-containing protein [Marinibactrum halimedae]MCD9460978.1 DUF58 domain-containing protein [Marinibactrum halimedae]GLS28078.1 hypothetical protein GCM10007877_37970 [Marinibactrum halimedae]